MAARKKASGNQTRTKRKVSRVAKADASESGNTHEQVKVPGNIPNIDTVFPTAEARLIRIQKLAYLKAEKRNFEPGHELQDWLEAEKEVDEALIPLPSY